MSTFRNKTIAGISWSVVSQVGRQLLQLAIGVILARLLAPRQFGLIAMITVITGFAAVFAELGFGAALIHKQDVKEEHLSSVFWINIGGGIALTVLFMLGAPLIGAFYNEPLLAPLTLLVASTFFFDSLSIIQRTLFSKSIDFKMLSIVEVSAVGIAGVVAIGMALSGWGVWSLAAKAVITSVVTSILLWTFSSWRPDLAFHWSAVKELLGFSMHLLGSRTMNYWVRNLDDLLIGRVIGSGGLGVYSRAYAIMLFPLRNISRVIARVMFPSLATIQHDAARVRHIFQRATRTIALVTFPLMLGLLATTESFVLAVFGGQWAGMIPILQVFCFIGLVQSVVTLVGSLFQSQGRTDLEFRLGLVTKPLLITGIVVGLQWGIVEVAVGYASAVAVSHYLNLRFAGGLVGLRYYDVVRDLTGIFFCAAAMAAGVYGAGLLLPADWPHGGRLAVQVPMGVVFYLMLVHGIDLSAYREARTLLAEQWTRMRQAQT